MSGADSARADSGAIVSRQREEVADDQRHGAFAVSPCFANLSTRPLPYKGVQKTRGEIAD